MLLKIGDKAKVVFIAETPDGFEEIATYDLNAVFEALWRQKKDNQAGTVQTLSPEMAKKLRNEDYQKPTTPGPLFERRVYLQAISGAMLIGAENFFLRNNVPGGGLSYFYNNTYDVSPMLGVSVSSNMNLREGSRYALTIRYGLGVDYFSYDRYTVDTYTTANALSGRVVYAFDGNQSLDAIISNSGNIGIGAYTAHVLYPHLQMLPVVHLKNATGKKTWNFGVGARMGSIAQIAASGSNSTPVFNRASGFRLGLTSQIGWKYLALIFNVQPSNDQRVSYYGVGLRLGY
jgi:hypothetical protein